MCDFHLCRLAAVSCTSVGATSVCVTRLFALSAVVQPLHLPAADVVELGDKGVCVAAGQRYVQADALAGVCGLQGGGQTSGRTFKLECHQGVEVCCGDVFYFVGV